MTQPCYIDLEQARYVLAKMGVNLSKRQVKRAAEMNVTGQRKLPFFIDPIEKKLKINKNTLIKLYLQRQLEAERMMDS